MSKSGLTDEMIRNAVYDEYGSMFVDVAQEFRDWLKGQRLGAYENGWDDGHELGWDEGYGEGYRDGEESL